MNIITIDFETAYDDQYSLRHMTTTEYILDPRFQIIGVGVKLNREDTEWCSMDQLGLAAWASKFPWKDSMVVAHNAMFDGAILEWKLGLKPKMYFCTMMGSRPWAAPFINGRMHLAGVSQYFGIGKKGDEVMNAKAMWRQDFSAEQLLRYAAYCINDVELSYKIFRKLVVDYPRTELRLLDLTVKKFVRPKLQLDRGTIIHALRTERDKKNALIAASAVPDKGVLTSNAKFAQALVAHGVTPPMKRSLTTGQRTYAFAKTDHEFMALLKHGNPKVRALVEARLAVKSTIEESRLERFRNVSAGTKWMPVPLLYYGAHTGRLSGLDKLNLQNLTRASALRRALVAPPGYKLVVGDLSQIEARLLATLAGETDLVRQFAGNEDVYCNFASTLYNRTITKEDKRERFIGKTCILGLGYGMGHTKFLDTVRPVVPMNPEAARATVSTYRRVYKQIPKLWSRMDDALNNMLCGGGMELGPIRFDWYKLRLPNGMPIFYSGLRQSTNGFVFSHHGNHKSIWGGALTENIVQALARIVIGDAELAMANHGRTAALQVHDELVYVVKKSEVEEVRAQLETALTTPPKWMPELPLACETGVGYNYAEAK